MKLYYLPGACQIGIHALLAEIGRPFKIEQAARPDTPEFEAYTQINPKGKVPALIRDDGSLLTEFPVIALYLARINPERELIPTDVEGEIRVLEMTEYLVSTVHMQGYTRARRPGKFTPNESDHEAVKAQGLKIFQAGLDRAEQQIGGKEWLFDKMSIADFALFYLEHWCVLNGIGTLGPRCQAHHDRLWSKVEIRHAVESELIA
ncbi:glutathione S-transferase [Aestuariicella hydrocarbonica]|uniref:Glutathione S-transferase n=1 Tax=Pseudomaricurvus hydrocarbonicus TaxID=1470433 RepID=A0A9E5T4U6_9GAMM|nr:glutathione S-transferase C-terminal domain-containing protein [Aestuariicella hydrocarbonica]NHO68327.1 glutathione S-transferase [Aestuariicella hydrocarbonica]